MNEDKDKSALAEEVNETLPTEDTFDASKFTSRDVIEETEETEETEEAVAETEETSEETQDTEITAEGDSEFSWDEDTEEETEESKEEKEEGEEETEEAEEGDDFGWESLAEELGFEVENYDEFKDALVNQKELATAGATNKTIQTLKGFVDLGDEELMRTELKAQEYSDEDIDDEIDIMVENNTIRQNARRVRKDLEKAISAESERVISGDDQMDATQQEEIDQIREDLKKHMSKTTNMFGGSVTDKQKDEHFNYIDSGKFFDEISGDAESVANAAWLWKNRDRILNGYKSKGFEQGKASIIDSLSHPETARTTRIPEPETGNFNPNKFIDNESM